MSGDLGRCADILHALAEKLRGQGRLPQPDEMEVSPLELARCLELAVDHCSLSPEMDPQPAAPQPSADSPGELVLHADGGSRGNPGPAGAGAWLSTPQGGEVARLSRYLGVATNNVAEYQGLIMGLEAALEKGARRLKVFMDSELLVRQMIGQYRVKAPHLRPLFQQASALAARFESVEFRHIPREFNAQADALANQAMDRRG